MGKKKGKKDKKAEPEPEPPPADESGDEDEEEDILGDQSWAQTSEADFTSGVDDMFADLFGADPNAAAKATRSAPCKQACKARWQGGKVCAGRRVPAGQPSPNDAGRISSTGAGVRGGCLGGLDPYP